MPPKIVVIILKTLAIPGSLCHNPPMARSPDIDLQHKPSETLLQNKRRMGAAKDKFADVRENGVRPERPQADRPMREGKVTPAKIARGATGRDSDFELIMGKASKPPTSKVKVQDLINYHVEKKGQGRSDSRPSTLHIPLARPQRLATEDGRTSFHFSHDSVAKTRAAVVSDSGKVNRPGAASAHNRYIERDEAVALDERAVAEAALEGIDPITGEIDPEHAAEVRDAAAVTQEDGAAVDNQEPYFDRPLRRSFLRTYRAALGALLADPEPDPRGQPPGQVDGLRDVPGRGLVPDARNAEMLLWSHEVPLVGRDRAGGQGLRRPGDGDHEGRGGGAGLRLSPVPARLSRVVETRTDKAVAALAGRTHVEPPKPVQHDHSTAEGEGRYIERQEALAMQPDGTRVLFTNIDKRADKRAEFWRLVEENERDASPDRITFTINENADFWANVSAHEKCPASLREALAAADPARKVTVETDDNVAMRRFLSSVEGWRKVGQKREEETPEAYRERASRATCKFQDGRGGRVQYRIIGELPHELDVKGRASVLETFSREFEKRKLPFVAVMHAPDHTNNDKNWHFHLVYYDRPCRRLTAEDVANTPPDPNPKNTVVEPVPATAVGDWDFTAVEKYKTSSREVRERRPFAQEKVKEVSRQQDWVEKMRVRLAEITNDHLQEAGVERRLDPRRHTEMGIHSNPQEHLGTKLSNLEAMGIATPRGVSNEERQWEAMQRKLDGDLERRKSVVEQQARKWLQKIERARHLDEAGKVAVRANVTRWNQHRNEAEEHLAIAENLDQHMSRMMSRAMKVKETCTKNMNAIAAGKATKYQSTRLESLTRKSDEAIEWLADATRIMADEAKLAKDCRQTSDREMLISEQLELTIERALVSTGIREVAAEAKRRDREEAELQREAARQRDATQKAQDEKRRALVKEEMDAWIDAIRKSHRRLVQDGRRIVPLEMTPQDRSMVEAINYGAMATRLAGIKKNQDLVVADVVKAVRAQPENVIRQQTETGSSYVFVTSNRTVARAFRDYAADPAVAEAREAALRTIAQDAERRAENRRIAAADRARAERPQTAERPTTGRPAPDRTAVPQDPPAQPASRRDVEAKDAVAPSRDQTRPVRDPAPARAPVDDAALSPARAAVHARTTLNERIFRAVRRDAMRIAMRDGIATLSEQHLERIGVGVADLEDRTLQNRLAGLAREQDRDLKRITAYARKMPDRLVERDGVVTLGAKAPQELVEKARYWNEDRALDLALRTIREEARRGAAVDASPRQRTPGDQAPDRAVAPSNEGVPAPSSDRTPAPAAAPAPAAVESPAPAASAPTPAPQPERPRFTDLEPDYEMREEARRYAQEQERLRQQASARPTRTTAAERAGEDPVSRAVRIATQKAATGGAHPLIDEWIEGVRAGMTVEDRQALALRITSERQAREKLRAIDRNVARRIRDDSDAARDRQQPGLGLEIDRGLTPKR